MRLYENVDRKFAEAYWFWFFYTAPNPIPETFIKDKPEFFMEMAFSAAKQRTELQAVKPTAARLGDREMRSGPRRDHKM